MVRCQLSVVRLPSAWLPRTTDHGQLTFFWRRIMLRIWGSLLAGLALTAVAAQAEVAAVSIKLATTPPPAELKEAFRQLLSERSIQVFDAKGGQVGEFWFRKT